MSATKELTPNKNENPFLVAARWRVVDIVVASVLAVAGGLIMAAWNVTYEPFSDLLAKQIFPPASALVVGVWLLPGVLGALVVRKLGAAIYVELVAATISALIGNKWGMTTIWYGLLEGLGAELIFAILLYRQWNVMVATLSGVGAGICCGLLDIVFWYPDYSATAKTIYVVLAMISGAVIAGLGSWYLTKALHKTGALRPLASGRDAELV